jgi:hypothetical protein
MRLFALLWNLLSPTPAHGGHQIATYYTRVDDSPVTACGGMVRDHVMHAAVRSARCGERVRVTSVRTGRSEEFEVDDFGPNAVELDGTGNVDWQDVYLNPSHPGVWTPRDSYFRGCRRRGTCDVAPLGFRFRADVDIPPQGFYRIGEDPRTGRIRVLIRNLGRKRR